MMIGVNGYLNGTPDEAGKVSPTALIPAGIGAILIVCGALAFKDGLRKHVMHAAAMVGVFGILGGFMPLIRQAAKGKDFDPLAPAARNGLMMTLVCVAFVFLCVQSFIAARRARQAAGG